MQLNEIWFLIVGFLFIGYFVLDGFDFGVGMALPFLGKDDTDRRVLINTIGPVWDLNETWVLVAGASLFAARGGTAVGCGVCEHRQRRSARCPTRLYGQPIHSAESIRSPRRPGYSDPVLYPRAHLHHFED